MKIPITLVVTIRLVKDCRRSWGESKKVDRKVESWKVPTDHYYGRFFAKFTQKGLSSEVGETSGGIIM